MAAPRYPAPSAQSSARLPSAACLERKLRAACSLSLSLFLRCRRCRTLAGFFRNNLHRFAHRNLRNAIRLVYPAGRFVGGGIRGDFFAQVLLRILFVTRNTLQARLRRQLHCIACRLTHLSAYRRHRRIVLRGPAGQEVQNRHADHQRNHNRNSQIDQLLDYCPNIDVAAFVCDTLVDRQLARRLARVVAVSAHDSPWPPPASARPAATTAAVSTARRKTTAKIRLTPTPRQTPKESARRWK